MTELMIQLSSDNKIIFPSVRRTLIKLFPSAQTMFSRMFFAKITLAVNVFRVQIKTLIIGSNMRIWLQTDYTRISEPAVMGLYY